MDMFLEYKMLNAARLLSMVWVGLNCPRKGDRDFTSDILSLTVDPSRGLLRMDR